MEKKGVKFISIAVILVFVLLSVYKTGINIKRYFEEKKIYREAVAYINCGKVDEAREMFFRLGDYEDSRSYVEDLLKSLDKGDTFLFGEYEQDGNTDNGPEPIEWIVIGRTETKALLLSKYCIEKHPYNNRYEKTTWEKSDIRKWLNGPFVNTAFSEKQAEEYIIEIENVNNKNIVYDTDAGADTKDKVFLLSEKEFKTYLDEGDKIAYGSKSVIENGYSHNGKCLYWLRTPGSGEYNAININLYGDINYMGYAVNHTISKSNPDVADTIINLGSLGIRPSIWIKTE